MRRNPENSQSGANTHEIEPLKISTAREPFGLPMPSIRTPSLVETAMRFGFTITEDGYREVERTPYIAICACEKCTRNSQPEIIAENWQDAFEKMQKRHTKLKFRCSPLVQTVKQANQGFDGENYSEVEAPKMPKFQKKRRDQMREVPYLPPHKDQKLISKPLTYSKLVALLTRGYKPDYLRENFNISPGRAEEILSNATKNPIQLTILKNLLLKHGTSVLSELKLYFEIPIEIENLALEKISQQLGYDA
ncbi:MAG: hypothetical protein WAU07_04980 [Microgenomates group bacterium]